jgi:hypothetical protein
MITEEMLNNARTGTVKDYGRVVITGHMFVAFCKEMLNAIRTDTGFHPPVPKTGYNFICEVSPEQIFSKHEGLCFNFVSWLFYRKFGGSVVYTPTSSLYESHNVELHDLFSAAERILTPFFTTVRMDDEERTAAKHKYYPFGYSYEFGSLRKHGTFYEDAERIKFLEQVCFDS